MNRVFQRKKNEMLSLKNLVEDSVLRILKVAQRRPGAGRLGEGHKIDCVVTMILPLTNL